VVAVELTVAAVVVTRSVYSIRLLKK
jgi:hypothetical protein